ncbi:DUF1156 domain-containing protein [Candidatus Bipolaricaulota bacterium]|nr:DUF1156 domain-containing protein [Candidatus Bipolaricaulota bacterium]
MLQRKFIEHDLPLKEISEESAREKNIRHGHPSTLHIWWARKPLAASRAVALATLLDDPGEENPEKREEIRDLIKEIVPWEEVKNGNSDTIKRAQELVEEQYGDNPPKVLDPFAGGGSIPLESLRVGAETYASDYNPVAVLTEKATVEWPQKFGVDVEIPEKLKGENEASDVLSLGSGKNNTNLLALMVERWANKVSEEAKDEIGQFYPEEGGTGLVGKKGASENDGWIPVGYYYNRTITCQNPNCNTSIPLTANFWLAKKKNKKIAYRPITDKETNKIDFELLQGKALEAAMNDGFDPSEGTVSRANATCPLCGQVTKAEQVRQLARGGDMDQEMIAVVLHHPDETGKKYRLANEDDLSTFKEAKSYLEKKIQDWPYMENPLPNEDIPNLRGVIKTPLYGIEKWKDLFNSRQQLAMITFLEKIRDSYKDIKNEMEQILEKNQDLNIKCEAFAKAIMGYLGIILDRQADYNSTLAIWCTGGFISHTFGRQALPMTWDFFELNPFSLSTGDWKGAMDWVLRFIKNNQRPGRTKATTKQTSATDLPFADSSFDAIVTDPPYYYDITYADLSDFFYVWLKRSIGEYFPELFSTPLIPKEEEILEGSFWDKELYQHKDSDFFEEKLKKAFNEMNRVLKPGGIAAIIYAHKTTEGWETMLNGLLENGFVVTASWPVHTERDARLSAARSASLASSIYMVCRKTEREELGFWKDLKPNIEKRVEEKLDQFWKEGIVGGDLFISAIGPGMEIFSQYKEVQKYSGEEVLTLELLTFIRSITTDFVVNRLLKDASPSEIDKESQFYLAYRWTYLDNKVEYDAARKIASGMGVDIEEMDDETGFVKKTRKYVRVYGPEDRTDYEDNVDDIEVNTMVDAMHKSLLLWEDGRKEEINELLAETGYAEQGSFWQFCQAVSESLVQGNDEKKKLEGFLMGRDKYVQSAKEMNEQAEKTKDMFEED